MYRGQAQKIDNSEGTIIMELYLTEDIVCTFTIEFSRYTGC